MEFPSPFFPWSGIPIGFLRRQTFPHKSINKTSPFPRAAGAAPDKRSQTLQIARPLSERCCKNAPQGRRTRRPRARAMRTDKAFSYLNASLARAFFTPAPCGRFFAYEFRIWIKNGRLPSLCVVVSARRPRRLWPPLPPQAFRVPAAPAMVSAPAAVYPCAREICRIRIVEK